MPTTLMILWGVPGAGKSTYARWLADNKGFTHVDTDAVCDGEGEANGPHRGVATDLQSTDPAGGIW